MKTYKIRFRHVCTDNELAIAGQSEFNNIEDAMKKALSEKDRLIKEFGGIETGANKRGWFLEWCYENCLAELELCKYIDGEITELQLDDYTNVDPNVLEEFEKYFVTTGWATCKTGFFFYE